VHEVLVSKTSEGVDSEATIAKAKKLLAPEHPLSLWLADSTYPIDIRVDPDASVYINCGPTGFARYTDTIGRTQFLDASFSPFGDDLPQTPTVFTGLASQWAALKWTAASLAERCLPSDVFAVDGGPSFARESLNSASVSMQAYAEYAGEGPKATLQCNNYEASGDEAPLYIFDPEVGRRKFVDGSLMRSEYSIPTCLSHDAMDAQFGEVGALARPLPLSWLLVGATGSGTPIHNHPMTAAWNTLLAGVKLWVVLPPSTPEASLLVGESCPVHQDEDLSAHAWFRHWGTKGVENRLPQSTIIIQKPGETVFLPAGYYHCVLNVSPAATVALSCSIYLRRDWGPLGEVVARKGECEGFQRVWEAGREG